MKKVKTFSKAFPFCAILSCVLILFGIVGFCLRGINFGIDFVPGLVEEVRIAPAVMEVTYNGTSNVNIETSSSALELVISGGNENDTKTFSYGQNPTVNDIAHSLSSVSGVSVSVKSSPDADSYGIYIDSASTSRLSSDAPVRLYASGSAKNVSIEDVRESLSDRSVAIKEMGDEENRSFQIRVALAKDSSSSDTLLSEITSELKSAFGEDTVAIVKTDFVGSGFSKSNTIKSIVLALVTLFAIWLYATIRFHWDFALGAIIALLHDFLIMFSFISWTQVEFSTTTFAAVLTIFGYSINATVVILDRVRENIRLVQTRNFNDILNTALTGTLTRSVITTVTTLFASLALLIFTSGSIHDFAVVLTVGLLSGCYSSMFISSGFISLMRRHWEPGEDSNHVRPHRKGLKSQNNVIQFNSEPKA